MGGKGLGGDGGGLGGGDGFGGEGGGKLQSVREGKSQHLILSMHDRLAAYCCQWAFTSVRNKWLASPLTGTLGRRVDLCMPGVLPVHE